MPPSATSRPAPAVEEVVAATTCEAVVAITPAQKPRGWGPKRQTLAEGWGVPRGLVHEACKRGWVGPHARFSWRRFDHSADHQTAGVRRAAWLSSSDAVPPQLQMLGVTGFSPCYRTEQISHHLSASQIAQLSRMRSM